MDGKVVEIEITAFLGSDLLYSRTVWSCRYFVHLALQGLFPCEGDCNDGLVESILFSLRSFGFYPPVPCSLWSVFISGLDRNKDLKQLLCVLCRF